MGKKSSSKKQRSSQSTKQRQDKAVQPRQGMELASLSQSGVVTPTGSPEVARKTAPVFGEQTEFIRSDIMRIGILLLGVVILLVATVIWNHASSALFNLGGHISSFMGLQ